MRRALTVSGIALAALLWALPAEAYHCRAGKLWLRHERICVGIQHQTTRHARVRRHHAHSYVHHEHSYARRVHRVRLARHRPIERVLEEPAEEPTLKRGDRLAPSLPKEPADETPTFTVPFDVPRSIMRSPIAPQWRL